MDQGTWKLSALTTQTIKQMIRTYKRKLILTPAQEQRLLSWIGACRVVYNLGLEVRKEAYRINKTSVHKYELMKQITELRGEVEWIKDVPVGSMQDTIERLDKTYKSFFKGGGYPKFANKKKFNSILFKHSISVSEKGISVPKLGILKVFKDSAIIGTPKTVIITKEAKGFFICIQCKDVPKKFTSENQAIGLDMGLSYFCIKSNGEFIDNPQHFRKYERRLRIENRSLARKKKGSNSWKKQVQKLALLHHKIANTRKDFLHKESTKIAKAYSTVCMENLKISNMVRNKNLSANILDAGWGIFKVMLEYKTNVIKVNPAYTSQTCNECGAKDKKSRMSQSEFCCTSCGHVSNADLNAAKNILSQGMALSR